MHLSTLLTTFLLPILTTAGVATITNHCASPVFLYTPYIGPNTPKILSPGSSTTSPLYPGPGNTALTIQLTDTGSVEGAGPDRVDIYYTAQRRNLSYWVAVFGLGFGAGKVRLQADAVNKAACPGVVDVLGSSVVWTNKTGGWAGQSCLSNVQGVVVDLCV